MQARFTFTAVFWLVRTSWLAMTLVNSLILKTPKGVLSRIVVACEELRLGLGAWWLEPIRRAGVACGQGVLSREMIDGHPP